MAANKKPNHLKILNGSAKQHPERHKEDHLIPEPSAGIGEAPDCLNEFQAEIWDEIVSITPAGVLGNSDRVSLELLCRLIAAIRLDENITASHFTQYISLASRFGLTPSDRQRVKVPEKPKSNGFKDV